MPLQASRAHQTGCLQSTMEPDGRRPKALDCVQPRNNCVKPHASWFHRSEGAHRWRCLVTRKSFAHPTVTRLKYTGQLRLTVLGHHHGKLYRNCYRGKKKIPLHFAYTSEVTLRKPEHLRTLVREQATYCDVSLCLFIFILNVRAADQTTSVMNINSLTYFLSLFCSERVDLQN